MKKVSSGIKRILNEKYPLRFIFSRIFLRLGIDLPRVLIFDKDLDVRTYLHASSAAHKLFIGRYKPALDVAVFKRYIKENDVVFDVGANIGMFSVIAARLSKSGLVYAFEATPKTFSFLLSNLQLNRTKNIYPVYGAVCDAIGLVSFFEHKTSHEQNHIAADNQGSVTVPAVSLGAFADSVECRKINFLKIDVEGAELSVLRSLGRNIDNVEVIYFEFTENNSSRFGYTIDDLQKYFSAAGFEIFTPYLNEGELLVKPFNKDEQDTRNLLAIKK